MLLFTTTTIAGGAACNSAKGVHGLSAEAWKEIKENHAWNSTDGVNKHSKTTPNERTLKSDKPTAQKPDLVAI